MNAPKPENVCAICKKVFSRKADCNRHVRLHAGIRPYLCEFPGCGKRFAQFTALKTHRNVHTGSKPFKCEFAGCKATFGDPSSCARHRREIHSPATPYKCTVAGCSSSIRRWSSFKTHLRKHGVDPRTYTGPSQRDHSPVEVWRPTEPEGTNEGEVSILNGSSCDQGFPLSDLPGSWDSDSFLSIPGDPSVPLVLQPEFASMISSSSPLLFAPAPRIAQDNEQFFLSPPRASPSSSSRYSSPMASTPVLTPDLGFEYLPDFSVRLSSCLATAQDWTRNAWQDHGIQFVG